jgi:Na+-translocating ferredoxin:NAD+ oxidoreductase RNF subunit RnfB
LTEVTHTLNQGSSVVINEALCNGCVLCMKACPTKAIRVRGGIARIEGVCVDCVECVRVCPRGAIKELTPEYTTLKNGDLYVVSPSSVLYSQFGGDFLPNDILLGLRAMGYGYVHDQSYTSEIYNFATELYIREERKKPEPRFPLISAICPIVERLVAYRFPLLLEHILPLATPREIVRREAKKRFSEKNKCRPEDVSLLHITPCPAISSQIMEPSLHDPSSKDRAIGISIIHERIRQKAQEQSMEQDRVLHYSGGVGVGWGKSGGEIASLNAHGLAVSGLHETIRYLEKVEMGLLEGIEFLELRGCTEGCIGGPFTVADRYQAKHLIEKLVHMFGEERRIKYDYVLKLYNEGWFCSDRKRVPLESTSPRLSISKNIERQNKVENLLRELPGMECGACGSPDCRTFAEDLVDGRARLEDCVWRQDRQRREVPREC